jgi:hypothetical protein
MRDTNGTATTYDKAAEEARKAKADADAAETAAEKARREEDEASSPAAVARREVVAEKDAAAARREQLTALVPDLTKVERGSLDLVKDGQPTAGTAVAGRALQNAAELIKREVIDQTGADGWSLLITSDGDLAASDAAYQSTVAALDRVTTWADAVLKSTDVGADLKTEALPGIGVVAAAAAQAVPGILSLLSAHRTITTGPVTITDLAASAAVAGVLKGRNAKRTIFHDSVRLLPSGEISTKVDTLYTRRQELIERKALLESRKPTAAGNSPSEELASAIGLVASVSDNIGELLGDLTTVPTGATRSPLAAAILREGLHDGTFQYVLLVKAESASGMQLVNDRPLLMDDKFAVLAAASISWVLLEAKSGGVLDAGVTTGTAQARGVIGNTFALQDAP